MRKQPGSSHHKPDSAKGHKKDARRGAAGSENKPVKKRRDSAEPDRPRSDRDKEDRGFRSRPSGDSPKKSFERKKRTEFGAADSQRPERTSEKDSEKSERGSFRKDTGKRPFSEGKKTDRKRPYGTREDKGSTRPYGTRDDKKPARSFDRPARRDEAGSEGGDKERRPARRKDGDKPFGKSDRSFDKKPGGKSREFSGGDRKPARSFDRPRKRDEAGSETEHSDRKPARRTEVDKPFARSDKRFDRKPGGKDRDVPGGERKPARSREGDRPAGRSDKRFDKRPARRDEEDADQKERKVYPAVEEKPIESAMTLNKYIAHSGESSRRDAAEMVKQGKVRVNGELVLEPGYRIVPGDQVTLSGKKLTSQKGLVYILMNKPKGYITTTEDPEERKTVMDLVTGAGVERLFPVGRLDRNTTGVLLLTNDGPLAHRLAHPSYNIKKVYHVTLDKNLTRADYEKISKGVTLEDGPAPVDAIAYLENRHEIGLEIHSGKNRIVRRIFESLGYSVEKLDRMMYAGLTKKNVPRGKWRFLLEKEVIFLKHFK